MRIITKHQAQKKGLRKYYIGVPCVNGHFAERYTSTGACLVCHKRSTAAAMKRWFAKNKAYWKEYYRQWYEKNKDHQKANCRRRYYEMKEKIKESK